MIIAFDIDGVLAEAGKEFIKMINKFYDGIVIDESRYDFGLDAGVISRVHTLMVRCKAYENLSLTEDALDILILNSDDVIWYVTARSAPSNGSIDMANSVREQTMRWLAKHKFPQHENLIFSADKVKTCIGLDAKYLVEDNWDAVQGAYEEGITAYLIDKPYNRSEDLVPFGEYSYPNRVRTIREAIRRARETEKATQKD